MSFLGYVLLAMLFFTLGYVALAMLFFTLGYTTCGIEHNAHNTNRKINRK